MSNKKKSMKLSPSDKLYNSKSRTSDNFELKQICSNFENKYYWVETNYLRKL